MSKTIRRLVTGSVALLLCGLIFFIGYNLGYEQAATQSSALAARVNALQHYYLLSKLEHNKIADVKEHLNLMLDTDILEIYGSQSIFANHESDAQAIKVLAKIAEHRKKYPHQHPAGEELEKQIKVILDKAAEEAKQK